jgi:hypothetical protein
VKFGNLLHKAKELVADKAKLSEVVDQATDLLNEKTGHKFAAELDKIEGFIGNLKSSDLDVLDGLVAKLDSLDENDIEQLKHVVGQLSASRTETLDQADIDKLEAIAAKLGVTEAN